MLLMSSAANLPETSVFMQTTADLRLAGASVLTQTTRMFFSSAASMIGVSFAGSPGVMRIACIPSSTNSETVLTSSTPSWTVDHLNPKPLESPRFRNDASQSVVKVVATLTSATALRQSTYL